MILLTHTKEGQHFEEWVYTHNDKNVVVTHFIDTQPSYNVFVTSEGRVSPITDMWDYEMYHPIDDNDREWYLYRTREECDSKVNQLLN